MEGEPILSNEPRADITGQPSVLGFHTTTTSKFPAHEPVCKETCLIEDRAYFDPEENLAEDAEDELDSITMAEQSI
jgi:hypothetical protein